MRRLVALDRDGTLIEERPYLSDPRLVTLLPGTAEGLRALQRQGFALALVSNQSGVGRGFFGLEAVQRVNERLNELLAQAGVSLDGVYVCPHAPWAGCDCRKPGTGLLARAAGDLGISLGGAFVVGDKPCDITMGRRAGATTLLVRTGWGRDSEGRAEVQPHYIVDDLSAAASTIISRSAEGVMYAQSR